MTRVRHAWLAYWGAMRRYHRYEVVGLEHLDGPPALLVGYHARPIAYDLCMLQSVVYERLGYLVHGVVHRAVEANGLLQHVAEELELVTGDGPEVAAAVARGEHLCVQPGGTREGCRSLRHRHEVFWGSRVGFLRLALRHGLPIVPVAGRAVDHGYIGLNNGDALGRRLQAPAGLPVWLGLGPLGLWPFSPPFPVHITQYVGAPIPLPPTDPEDRDALLALQLDIAARVQDLLDMANA